MKPSTVFSVGGMTVTSSMIVAFATALGIILIVQVAMRRPQLVPSGLQNFIEWIVEVLSNQLEQILGHKMMTRTFWFFATIFVFIVGCNLVSLLPIVGTVGMGHGPDFWHFEVDRPWFRGANADANMTGAMAVIFFFLFFYWTFRALGFIGWFKHVFSSPVKFANPFANLGFGLVFFLLGFIELFSILFIRPLAFTFRLYGNIFGGEYLLHSIYEMAPGMAWLLLAPFYALELLVAFIQATVFCLLTAVFTRVLCGDGSETQQGEAH